MPCAAKLILDQAAHNADFAGFPFGRVGGKDGAFKLGCLFLGQYLIGPGAGPLEMSLHTGAMNP